MFNCLRFSSLAALAAGASLIATPVAALDLPTLSSGQAQMGVSHQAGWERGRHHRRGGIDAGDVIAGVLVLGAIAAIAGAAGDNDRDEYRRRDARYPDPDDRDRDIGRDNYRTPMRGDLDPSGGIENAVRMCVDHIEEGNEQVESVDVASRTADGWRISGALDSGSPWNCWIDNEGRIREIDLAGSGYDNEAADYGTARSDYGAYGAADGQLSDEAYAAARAVQGGTSAPILDSGQQPAYPGGPLPGEEGYEESLRRGSAI